MLKKNSISLFFLLNSLWEKIKPKRRRRMFLLVGITIISSFSEIISLSSLIPFLSLLTKPEYLLENKFSKFFLFNFKGIDSFSLLMVITLILILSAFLSSFLKIYTQWEIRNLSADIGSDLSEDVFKSYIYRPYESIIMIESSNIIATLTADITELINSAITPFLSITSSLLISSSIIFTLFFIDGITTLVIFILLLIVYFISHIITGSKLQKIGFRRVTLRTELIKNLQESIGSIRDITLDNNQVFYGNIHNKLDRPLRKLSARMVILSLLPKSIIDPVGISIIALSGLFFSRNGVINDALPYLGALALGAQKITPQVQIIYQSWASLKGAKTVLMKVVDLLNNQIPDVKILKGIKPINLKKNIKFQNVSFKYKPNSKRILSNFNLEIKKGERVGIVGKTGSGKSTFIDLFMGLLLPSSGSIFIDEKELINSNYSSLITSWRLSIAHVPQNIFLLNATFAENIALGVPLNKIDFKRVKKAADQACISNFIMQTKNGFLTKTGERGINLSGGQRQRIGIARALYKEAKILVFDEATSALDNETEEAIINSLDAMDKNITLLFIAHRYSSLGNCDRIVEIKNGRVGYEGSFDSFRKRS